MSQVINTNALSLVAQNNLNKSQSTLGTAIQRLSSGLRINSAKDDAAGQAISNRFTTSINGLTQASRNANDGISIAQTTEGALNEINDNLQNIHRLAVQANNGTNSDSDRQSIQEEIDARLEEIDRISEQTEFNGVKVLKDDQSLTIQVGANDGQTISIDLSKMNSKTLGMDKFTVATGTIVDPTTLTDVTGTIDAPTGDKFDIGSLSDTAGTPAAGFTPDDIVVDDTGKYYATDGTDYVEITDPTTGEYDSTGITGTAPSGATSVLGQDITTPVTPTLDPSITDATLQTDDKGATIWHIRTVL
nr:flagellin FliC [Enterobacter pasteurii]